MFSTHVIIYSVGLRFKAELKHNIQCTPSRTKPIQPTTIIDMNKLELFVCLPGDAVDLYMMHAVLTLCSDKFWRPFDGMPDAVDSSLVSKLSVNSKKYNK